MKNVLVTGGCGFIGSNFVEYLCNKEEYHIVVLDKLTYAGNFNNLEQIDIGKYTFIDGDICDKKKLIDLFERFRFCAVFHFAAESHVDRSIDGPKQFIQTNIIGTFNLLEVSRSYLKKLDSNFKFIHISTDEVFGDISINKRSTEKDPYNPSSPYASTKAASDLIIKSYIRTYKFPCIITNCTNNFGPRQFQEKLIPKIILNILNNKNIPIYGNGKNQREWLYVKDHCKILLKLFQKGKLGETYNIGSGFVKSNLYIAKKILSLTKKKFNIKSKSKIIFVKDRKGHDFRYSLNSNKLNKIYDLKKNQNFEKSIIKTIEWYINNYNSINKIKI